MKDQKGQKESPGSVCGGQCCAGGVLPYEPFAATATSETQALNSSPSEVVVQDLYLHLQVIIHIYLYSQVGSVIKIIITQVYREQLYTVMCVRVNQFIILILIISRVRVLQDYTNSQGADLRTEYVVEFSSPIYLEANKYYIKNISSR